MITFCIKGSSDAYYTGIDALAGGTGGRGKGWRGATGSMTTGLRIRSKVLVAADSKNSLPRPKLTASTTERKDGGGY